MTKLESANKFFFQFFFVRLAKYVHDGKLVAWGLVYPVLPFTGWQSDYIILAKKLKAKIIKRF